MMLSCGTSSCLAAVEALRSGETGRAGNTAVAIRTVKDVTEIFAARFLVKGNGAGCGVLIMMFVMFVKTDLTEISATS